MTFIQPKLAELYHDAVDVQLCVVVLASDSADSYKPCKLTFIWQLE